MRRSDSVEPSHCRFQECTQPVHKDGLCYVHFRRTDYLDNSNIDDLGIVRFAYDLFPDRFDRKYAPCIMHKELLVDLLSSLEHGQDKYDRLHVIAAPREHSKSTWVTFLYATYVLVNALRWFVVIVSEDSEKTKQFIRAIKGALNRKEVKAIYGDLAPTSVNYIEGQKWSESHIVTALGQHIISLGIRQSTRGLLEEIGRPDLIIADDAESEQNTLSEDARKKNWAWWRKQVVPSADIVRGQCVYIGTMFAEDCILGRLIDLKPKFGGYRKRFYQVWIDEANRIPLWPDKFPPELISKIQADYEADEDLGLDQYYMEYYNIAVAPQNKRFGPSSIVRQDFTFWIDKHKRKWIKYGSEDPFTVRTAMGIDTAWSEKSWAKYTVIMTGAMDVRGRLFVITYSRGKYDIRNDPDSGREGMIEKTIEQINEFDPDAIGIATTGAGGPIVSELRRELKKLPKKPALIQVKESSDTTKIERIAATLVSIHKQRKVILFKGAVELVNELNAFPKGKYTDCLDAEVNLVIASKPPHTTYVSNLEMDLRLGPEQRESDEDLEELDYDWEIE